ncbi:hypothetical protein [Pseudosulfitobacter sp. SM2401]|uniref:hypothetical protein n=1 Tax=Pseudosulfitobacter sp. SM2401 TaxID=3350098 RepID=UPI0036F420D5
MCMTCAISGFEMQQVLHAGLGNTGLTITEGTDAPANTSTPYTMDVGDTFSGSISSSGEQDWVAVTFEAGQYINITQTGAGLSDPYLRLYDSNGAQVAFNDDANGSLNSEITYQVTTSGTYYVAGGAYGTNTGTYSLTVEDVPPPPPSNPLDAIDWGSKLASNSVDVYFGTNGYSAAGMTSEGFNAYQQAQFEAVFDLIEEVSGLTFNIVNTAAAADFKLIMDSNEFAASAGGFMNPPGYASGADAGVGAFNQNFMGSAAGGAMDKGGLGWYVIVHELMHGLGLAHPHDTGGNSVGNDSTVMDGVSSSSDTGDYYLNQGHYTMMSYNWQFSEGPVGTIGDPNLWGMAAGPMGFDIAVLQAKYGANLTHNSGSNTYVLGDVHGSGAHWKSIWDTGSIDTMRYNGTKDATIDLRAATLEQDYNGGGFVSAVAGVAGGYTIANGVVIETGVGGKGDDAIFGNAADNMLIGGLGSDTINGDEGNDTIRGQNGDDSITSGMGEDNIHGGGGKDYIRGGDDNDTIAGGDGSDTIEGGEGNDSLIGGAGENKLYGQGGNDTLVGGAGKDTLNSGGGDDFLKGAQGNDLLEGGNNNDTLWGGKGRDTINGGSGDDLILGGTWGDTLNGGGGDDTLQGGTDDDYLKGGTGADTFIFENGMGEDQLLGFDRTEDILRINSDLLSGQTTGAQVLATFGSVVGSDVVLDFGGGDTITLLWANNLSGIADDIVIF